MLSMKSSANCETISPMFTALTSKYCNSAPPSIVLGMLKPNNFEVITSFVGSSM